MKLKPYPKYKDSGVQWIGEIPEQWESKKLKFNYEIIGKTNIPASNGEDQGSIPFFTSGDNIKYVDKPVKFGEFIIVGDGGIPNFKYFNGNFSYSDHCFLLKTNGKIKTKFLYYYLISKLDQIDILCFQGMGLRNLDKYKFNSFFSVISKIEEQNSIVDFLDTKTSQLDQTIEKDKHLIELLKEKRTALINHVVTKGLDKNAKMKDSGIDWIGEIPEGWEVKRLRFNCNVNPTGKKVFSDDKTKVAFLPMEKVSVHGEYDSESTAEYWEVSSGFTYFINNDVLVAKITPCFENGKGAMVTNLVNGIGFGTTEFHVLRSYRNIIPKYLYYFTKTHFFRTIGEVFMKGSAGQQRISTDFTKDFCMMTPSKESQLQIVQYLDKETSKIDQIIKKIEEKINLMEEYKKSLIHHVVTGKVDVRGEV